jgi:hypothetical protein
MNPHRPRTEKPFWGVFVQGEMADSVHEQESSGCSCDLISWPTSFPSITKTHNNARGRRIAETCTFAPRRETIALLQPSVRHEERVCMVRHSRRFGRGAAVLKTGWPADFRGSYMIFFFLAHITEKGICEGAG